MKCIDAKIVSYMQFVLLEITSKSNWYIIEAHALCIYYYKFVKHIL